MAAVINSTHKNFCSVEDKEMRKTQPYLGYYEGQEIKKEVDTIKHNQVVSTEEVLVCSFLVMWLYYQDNTGFTIWIGETVPLLLLYERIPM